MRCTTAAHMGVRRERASPESKLITCGLSPTTTKHGLGAASSNNWKLATHAAASASSGMVAAPGRSLCEGLAADLGAKGPRVLPLLRRASGVEGEEELGAGGGKEHVGLG